MHIFVTGGNIQIVIALNMVSLGCAKWNNRDKIMTGGEKFLCGHPR